MRSRPVLRWYRNDGISLRRTRRSPLSASDCLAAAGALDRAVATAYDVFGAYDAGDIAFCRRCHTRVDDLTRALRAPDRRSLHIVDIAEFFDAVFASAIADVATFKALLPRVLELTLAGADDIAHLNVATLGRKLAIARWTAWPDDERRAVDAWARAWFVATLACGDAHDTSLDDVLSALAHMYDDIAPFLTLSHDATDPVIRQQIAHLVLSVCFALSHARAPLRADWSCIGAHWSKGSRPERQMLTWLATHASYERLLADAARDGCDCAWVRASTRPDVEAALATFARQLVEDALA